MHVVDISLHEPEEKHLAEALVALTEGGVVAFPTETSYGLAAIPTNSTGIERIYAMKARDRSKPLPLIAASMEDVERIVELPEQLMTLAHRHWPGPLTIVAPIRPKLAGAYSRVLGPGDTVAIRVSSLELARLLAAAAGGIITATSANISNTPSLYSGEEVRQEFGNKKLQPAVVLNGGALPPRPASTIVTLENDQIVVLREGAVRL